MPEEKFARAWKKYGGEKITHDKKYKLEKREKKEKREKREKLRGSSLKNGGAFYFYVTGQKLHASTATVTGSEKPRNHFCNSAG